MIDMKLSVFVKKNSKTMLLYALVTVAFIIMQSLSTMGMLTSSLKGYLIPICVYIVLTVSLNLVVGISGELSLGHAGFMGVGTFTAIIVSGCLAGSVENDLVRLILAMIAGGIIAGIAGVVIGVPVLRLRGDYLAIVTLAFGEILKNLAGNLYVGRDSSGLHFSLSSSGFNLEEGGEIILKGPMGASGIDRIATFPMGFILILFTLFVVLNLVNSKEGRAIKAVRDNRIAAESVGINVTAFRLKAFVVSAVLAGMAGALYGLNFYSITASKFNFNTSINILVFVVLGGMGNIAGSVISATLLYLLPEMLRELEDFRMILYAVVLIVVMLCTWSPKLKGWIQVVKANAAEKLSVLIKKKSKEQEAGTNE